MILVPLEQIIRLHEYFVAEAEKISWWHPIEKTRMVAGTNAIGGLISICMAQAEAQEEKKCMDCNQWHSDLNDPKEHLN